jgi:hypothetical protein
MRTFTPLAFACALTFAAGPTLAQDPTREAAIHFQRAITLYSEADYRAALAEFKRAYSIAPNVNVLYNIGQAEYQLQEYAHALTTFERYLAGGGTGHKAEVESSLVVLRTRVGSIDVSVDAAGAEVSVDDEVVGTSPLAKPILVSVGRHRVTASKAGTTPTTRLVEISAGEVKPLSIVLPAKAGATVIAPPPPPPAAGTKSEGKGYGYLVAWGVTGALGVATTTFGVLALSASGRLSDARGSFGAKQSDLDSRASTTTAFSVTTDVLLISTVAMAGVSLFLTLSQPSTERSAAKGWRGAPFTGTFQ